MNSIYSKLYNNGSFAGTGMGTWNTHPKFLSQSASMPKLGATPLPGCISRPYYNPGETSKPIITPELLKMQLLEYKINDLEKKKEAQAEELSNLLKEKLIQPKIFYPSPQIYSSPQPFYHPPPFQTPPSLPSENYLKYIKKQERQKGIRQGIKRASRQYRLNRRYDNDSSLDESDCNAIDEYYSLKRELRLSKMNKNKSCENKSELNQESIEKIIKENIRQIEMKQQEEFKKLRETIEKEKQKQLELEMKRRKEKEQKRLRERELKLEMEERKINEMKKEQKMRNSINQILNGIEVQNTNFSLDDEDIPDYIRELPKLIDYKIKENEKKKLEAQQKEDGLIQTIEDTLQKKLNEHLGLFKTRLSQSNYAYPDPMSFRNPDQAQLPQINPDQNNPNNNALPKKDDDFPDINKLIKEKLQEQEITEQIMHENKRKELEISMLLSREAEQKKKEEIEKIKKQNQVQEIILKEKEIPNEEPKQRKNKKTKSQEPTTSKKGSSKSSNNKSKKKEKVSPEKNNDGLGNPAEVPNENKPKVEKTKTKSGKPKKKKSTKKAKEAK